MKKSFISTQLKTILKDFGIHSIISEDMDYIDVGEDEHSITYAPSSKIQRIKDNGQDPWTTNRVSMKVGKFFNKIFVIDSQKLENLVNWYKTSYYVSKGEFDRIFSVVEGEDIRYWYNQKNYVPGGGTLNNSCMRGEQTQTRLDLYVDHPENCKLLIIKEGDKLSARALMWITDKGVYIDRVYTRYDKDQMLYKKYIDSKDYKSFFNRGMTNLTLKVKLKKSYTSTPYFDTFRLSGKTLSAAI